MSKQRVLLLGATGETGNSILNGLLESDNFSIEAVVRPSSSKKPQVQALAAKGVELHIADITGPVETLVPLLKGVDVVISAIDAGKLLLQKNLASAAKEAGVKRFVPCGFTTVAPVGDVMLIRDDKEEVYNHIKRLHLPYTIIDAGYWYQISHPSLPSGRLSPYMLAPNTAIHGSGSQLNILTDLRDIGRLTAKIISDSRTLNKYIFTCGEVLTENQIFSLTEEIFSEKVSRTHVSHEQVLEELSAAKKQLQEKAEDPWSRIRLYQAQYKHSKYVRGDNCPEVASLLGYLDTRELYPEFKVRTFKEFLGELESGKIEKVYKNGLTLS